MIAIEKKIDCQQHAINNTIYNANFSSVILQCMLIQKMKIPTYFIFFMDRWLSFANYATSRLCQQLGKV